MSTLLSMVLKENNESLNERAMSETQVIKLLKSLEAQFLLINDAIGEIDNARNSLENVLLTLSTKGVNVDNINKVMNCCKVVSEFGRKYQNNRAVPLTDAADIIIDFIEENKGNLGVKQ